MKTLLGLLLVCLLGISYYAAGLSRQLDQSAADLKDANDKAGRLEGRLTKSEKANSGLQSEIDLLRAEMEQRATTPSQPAPPQPVVVQATSSQALVSALAPGSKLNFGPDDTAGFDAAEFSRGQGLASPRDLSMAIVTVLSSAKQYDGYLVGHPTLDNHFGLLGSIASSILNDDHTDPATTGQLMERLPIQLRTTANSLTSLAAGARATDTPEDRQHAQDLLKMVNVIFARSFETLP